MVNSNKHREPSTWGLGFEAEASSQRILIWGLEGTTAQRWSARPQAPNRRAHARRDGKITLVTCIAILGLIVLGGFVGNAGHVVTTKVSTQNAADAIAFSNAQWMARGMNAITATNHLLGEVTGLVVAIEGIGGPEADVGIEDYPAEPKVFDQLNQKLRDRAIPNGGYGASAYGSVEGEILKPIVNMVSPDKEDKAKFKAWATVYDSKLILKRNLTKYLLIKSIANIGFMVPAPFGFATAVAAYAAHAYASYEIALIAKEYLILEGLELLVANPLTSNFKREVLERRLVPALAAHGDFIAGRPPAASKLKSGIVNAAMVETLNHLGEVYGVNADVFPAASLMPLPIEAEPAPSLKGSTVNEPEWGKDEPVSASLDDTLEALQDGVDEQKEKVEWRIRELEWSITGPPGGLGIGLNIVPQEGLNKLKDELEDRLETDLKPEDRTKIEEEIRQIDALVVKKRARIRELQAQLVKLQQEVDEVKRTITEAKNAAKNAAAGNKSIAGIPQKMNQAEERYTQWVRASYPYVDAFRAPVLKQFEEHLEESEAAKHYRKWTDRYTLVKAWTFRSGYHFEKKSEKEGEWRKEANDKPLTMYVMKGAYDKSAKRLAKGQEVWTRDTNDGKREAEQLFTMIGMTHREIEPLFSPVLYPIATEGGMTTFAQAIYYNGNEQKPPTDPSVKQTTQAKVGWDTLNWDPATATPEWGREPSRSNAKWPWEIFTSSPDLIGSARVKLNWQAKLMPVTQSRFGEAAAASLTNPDITENMLKAVPFFDPLVTH